MPIMEEIAEGECDPCGIVMASANKKSSQGVDVHGSEAIFLGGCLASAFENVFTLLELVTLIEAEVDGFLEVTMLDVTRECPVLLFVNCDFAVMLELGIPMVIPKEVSSDIDSCSVVKDMVPGDMSFVDGSRKEIFTGTSVWFGLYCVIESIFSSVLDRIRAVVQPCLVVL